MAVESGLEMQTRDDADRETNDQPATDCHPEGAASKLRQHKYLALEGSKAEARASPGLLATQALDPSRRTGHPRISPIQRGAALRMTISLPIGPSENHSHHRAAAAEPASAGAMNRASTYRADIVSIPRTMRWSRSAKRTSPFRAPAKGARLRTLVLPYSRTLVLRLTSSDRSRRAHRSPRSAAGRRRSTPGRTRSAACAARREARPSPRPR